MVAMPIKYWADPYQDPWQQLGGLIDSERRVILIRAGNLEGM